MPNHRFAVLILVAMLGFGMVTGGALPLYAQDAPIEPIDEAAGDAELVVDGLRYTRDREVPVNVSPLQETTDENGNPVYMKPGESDPLGAVYVLSPDVEGQATRYLPQLLGQTDAVCPADQSDLGTLQGNGATYAAAGPETDVTVDMLTQIGSTEDGATIYAEGNEQPLPEIFLGQGQGGGQLSRFFLTQENGVPAVFSDQLTFAGTEFTPAPGEEISLDGLVRIGCAGVFPAFAEAAEGPHSLIVLQVGGQAVSYRGEAVEETPAPEATPTGVPVEEPTEEPTEAPTEQPTEIPTEEPTEVPTEQPTEVPTEEPTEIPTEVPTEEPTEAPTEEPTEVPTEEPTEAPAEDLTGEPTEIPRVVPAEAPTEEPTEVPTEVPAEEPAQVVGEEPAEAVLPTAVPPTPAPGTPEPTLPPARPTPTPRDLAPVAVVPTVPADAPPPPASSIQTDVTCGAGIGNVDPDGVPERLPTNLQYGGASYRFTGQVAADDAGDLTRLGCVGPFVLSADPDDMTSVYLSAEDSANTLFRFQRTTTFTVRSHQATDEPRTIQTEETEDQNAVSYRATDPMVRSTYSSVSLILYVADSDAASPDRLLGYAVNEDVFGEYVPEGTAEQASQEVLESAEALGIHGELWLSGQRYVLTSLWQPFGTTTNGWVTLYGREGESVPAQLVGLDPRRVDLMVFNQQD